MGTAGFEAASEATRGGAEVTVVDKSERPDPPWNSWPDLIRASPGKEEHATSRRHGGEPGGTILVNQAKSMGADFVLASDGSKVPFDSAVVATGCGFEPPAIPGLRKPGVFVLDSVEQYSQLGRARSSVERAVVQGEGSSALQVAHRLSGSGRMVYVLVSGWRMGEPDASVLAVLRQAAEDNGVSVMKGTISRAAGSGCLEAVVLGGEVFSCDALAVLPARTPRVVPSKMRLGRGGGLLVDKGLRTSSPLTFAAGGCAELGMLQHCPTSLGDEAAISGRIAGANCAGQHLLMDSSKFAESTFFRLRWTKVAIELRAGNSEVGLETASHRWNRTTACAITYETSSGRVVGIESIQEATEASAPMPLLGSGSASLRSLAYCAQGGSSDISLVSDTARLGLHDWPRS